MSKLFFDRLFIGDISKWDVSNVEIMDEMFADSEFNSDISNWDVSNVTEMNGMFQGSNFNGDISKWDVSHVIGMEKMFKNSYFNNDISNWNISNVEVTSYMFSGSKFNGDISKWNTHKIVNMQGMFQDSIFNGDISNWDLSTCLDTAYMFETSEFNGDISKWDMSSVESVSHMFFRSKFNQDISSWIMKPLYDSAIFNECPIKNEFKPKKYQKTNHLDINENVNFDQLQNKNYSLDVIISALDLVDLGLPSGTLWCKHNLGAIDETDHGDYFAWGINTHDNYFSWTTYDYAEYVFSDSPRELTDIIKLRKYCIIKNDGFSVCDNIDNKTSLDLEDDAAYTKNKNYCIPTSEQYQELLDNTTNQIITNQGVTGLLLTSIHNGQTIFFPFSGYMDNYDVKRLDKWGCYWTNNLNHIQTQANIFCATTSMEAKISRFRRDRGLSIRPVLK